MKFLPSVPVLLAGLSSLLALSARGAANYGDDLAFLQKHTPVVELSDDAGARVAVVPAWQGRVMTSTEGGVTGPSYGWVNRELIASGQLQPHMNPFGGEDRFWLGPEGGQFGLFFAPGKKFEFADWQTPPVLDTVAFAVTNQARDRVAFQHDCKLTNYSGTKFAVKIEREVRLLPTAGVWQNLGVTPGKGVTVVGYESVNRITNTGKNAWRRKTGLLSIWILGMFNAAPETTVVLPIKPGADSRLGPRVNADYFGPVPLERLLAKEYAVFFRGDGKYRSKIGIGPGRARPVMGSWEPVSGVLTLVQYTLPTGAKEYVNSQWKVQEKPYGGDVVNSYTDDGKLGAFYELESSSPAGDLAPGKTLEHVHRTIHVRGGYAELNQIAQTVLGVGLAEIKAALPVRGRN